MREVLAAVWSKRSPPNHGSVLSRMVDSMKEHFHFVAERLRQGKVVPLLGAGANRCDRTEDLIWRSGRASCLPDGGELAEFLVRQFGYPGADERERKDLVRVSQYAAVMGGLGGLYDALHGVFNADHEWSPLHSLLAQVPSAIRAGGEPSPRYPVLVTTNYDDALERAFSHVDEPYDLVWYMAEDVRDEVLGDTKQLRGKFMHLPHGSTEPIVIEKPNEYVDVNPDRVTVILKMHGAVDRTESDLDSYVITEDHYIDYLSRTELGGLVPALILRRLRKSHFLFLGYSMRDWNLRVILHRLWFNQPLRYNSWAVQLDPEPLEVRSWEERHVEILRMDLGEYVRGLRSELGLQTDDADGH
jgi:SIR2-like domain